MTADGWAVTDNTVGDGWDMPKSKPPGFPRPAPGPQSAKDQISEEKWAKWQAEMDKWGDICIQCSARAEWDTMKICAHCEMNACEDCGSFVYGPKINFIKLTWCGRSGHVQKIWTCQRPDKRCPLEVKTGGLALNYLQTAYLNKVAPPPPPPAPPPLPPPLPTHPLEGAAKQEVKELRTALNNVERKAQGLKRKLDEMEAADPGAWGVVYEQIGNGVRALQKTSGSVLSALTRKR